MEDGTATSEGEVRYVGVSPTRVIFGGVRITGGGDIRLPPLEQSNIVHCNQAHYGLVSVGGEASGFMGVKTVVGAGSLGLGGDAAGGLGGRSGGVGGGDGQGSNGYRKTIKREDIVEK